MKHGNSIVTYWLNWSGIGTRKQIQIKKIIFREKNSYATWDSCTIGSKLW